MFEAARELGQRRIPGLKLHDDRLIRVLETLLHPGGFVGDWTTRDLHTRILDGMRWLPATTG